MNKMEYIGTNTGLKLNPASLSRLFGSLYVYRKKQYPENTTPAGVALAMGVLHFYKHLMPPASLLLLTSLPLTLVNGKETTYTASGIQPHSMWLKPLTFMKSITRQLKQTAIKQTACPDFSGAIKQTLTAQAALNDFTTRLNKLNLFTITQYLLLTTHY